MLRLMPVFVIASSPRSASPRSAAASASAGRPCARCSRASNPVKKLLTSGCSASRPHSFWRRRSSAAASSPCSQRTATSSTSAERAHSLACSCSASSALASAWPQRPSRKREGIVPSRASASLLAIAELARLRLELVAKLQHLQMPVGVLKQDGEVSRRSKPGVMQLSHSRSLEGTLEQHAALCEPSLVDQTDRLARQRLHEHVFESELFGQPQRLLERTERRVNLPP